MDFKGKQIQQLIHTAFPCSCGKTHKAEIGKIIIGKSALLKLPDVLREQKLQGRCFSADTDLIVVISDSNTRKAAGEKVLQQLKEAGFLVDEYCFENQSLHAEQRYVDELFEHLPERAALLIAVGSGSLNDITRYVAFEKKIPYYIVATAPSMDGYASNVSPIVVHNLKTTFVCKCADAIIGDVDILATCPTQMIGAGLGDIIGKYLSIGDWKLSRIINGEYCCDAVCELVLDSVEKCVAHVPSLLKREPEALQYLMESLVLIGIAMSFIGISRPASASEHHIAHFLEMKAIFAGEYGELHGTNVGMASCLISHLYQRFLDTQVDYDRAQAHASAFSEAVWKAEICRVYGLAADEVLKVEKQTGQNNPEKVLHRIQTIREHEKEIRDLLAEVVKATQKTPEILKQFDSKTSFSGYRIDRQEVKDCILYAKDLRSRYAALQFFYDLGLLDDFAEEIVKQYYDFDKEKTAP